MQTPGSARLAATALAMAMALVASACADGGGSSGTGPAATPPSESAATGATTSEELQEAVEPASVMRHLEALEELAYEHEETGFRAAGTPGYEAASAYVEEQLAEAGLEVERQAFAYPDFSLHHAELAQVAPAQADYAADDDFIPMGFSGAGEIEAAVEAVDVDLDAPGDSSSGCEAEDFDGFAVGGVALLQRGGCAFSEKAANAGEAGAAGVLVFDAEPGDGPLDGTLGEPVPQAPPTVGVSHDLGVELLESGATVWLAVDASSQTRETWNLIAEPSQGGDDGVLVLGAHLDGAAEGPAINDNGTGVATVLEVARQIAHAPDLQTRLRFAFWGAEEVGLDGSWHYVEELSAHDPESLDEIVGYLNFDMVGSPNPVIGVYDADESSYDAPTEPPIGSAALEAVLTDHFDRLEQPWVDQELVPSTDYQAFIASGIAVSGLFTGADDLKTGREAEWFGGAAGEPYDPHYHTADDDLDNVDPEALDIMADAVAHAAFTLGRDASALIDHRASAQASCAAGVCEDPALRHGRLER